MPLKSGLSYTLFFFVNKKSLNWIYLDMSFRASFILFLSDSALSTMILAYETTLLLSRVIIETVTSSLTFSAIVRSVTASVTIPSLFYSHK